MLDLLIVFAFVVYGISSGFLSSKKASQNLEEYFLAGKTLPGWKAGFSMAATQFAADTPLLVTGLIATGGIFMLWRLWIYGVAFLLMAFIFSTKWRRAGVLTDAELTEIRYSGKGVLPLRVLKAIYYGTVINCVVMAMVLVAAMRIAEVFLPWHEWLPSGVYGSLSAFAVWTGVNLGESVTNLSPAVVTTNNMISIGLILGFTALYSTTGGLRSVVATDVVQFILAMIGTLVYGVIVIRDVGGFSALSDRILEIYGWAKTREMLSFSPPRGHALMPFLIIISLQWIFQMNSDGTGYLAQRSMGCRSDKDARFAGVIFTWLQIFLRSLFWLLIGVGLLVIYPFELSEVSQPGFAASREILFVTGINDLLPPGIRGLMLTGMLAALASTIDTHLNWGASYWSNDIYKRLVCGKWLKRDPNNVELVLAARLSNLLILVIAIAIMANLGSIQDAWFISLLFGAGMGSVLVLRWLWERINLFSEIAAIAVSLAVAPILLIVTDEQWIHLGAMALVSTAAAVVVTFFTPDTKLEVRQEFYQRVRPAGFWKKTAASLNLDTAVAPRKLYRGLRATAVCSLSLFLLLTGIGKLLIIVPGQMKLWTWGYLLAGLALVPVWGKYFFELKPTKI